MSEDAPESQPHIFNDLYALLRQSFPAPRARGDILDVTDFAKALGLTHETIYRALRTDRLTIRVAVGILRLSKKRKTKPRLYWDDLIPFVLPEYEAFRAPPVLSAPPAELADDAFLLDADLDDFDLDDLDLDDLGCTRARFYRAARGQPGEGGPQERRVCPRRPFRRRGVGA